MERLESPTWQDAPFSSARPSVYDADTGREYAPDLELTRRIYKGMLRTRIVDVRMTKLQRQGRIGFHVGAEGEEAAIVASAAAMRPQDWLFPCYREIGAALYRGFPLQSYIDNMYGNENDRCLGRQMPDHITGRDIHFGSVTAPIGTQITQAVGFAWAAMIKRQDVVAGVYFGDGATSCNDFHAGMNFAAVFNTPTVFLLRNNGWAISMPADRQTASRIYADKSIAYGMRGRRCDGNDAREVYAVVREAVEYAASGRGPTLVELVTYRAGPHSTSDDPSAYCDPSTVPLALRRDPVDRLREYLEHHQAWSEAQQQECAAEIEAELQLCIERAEQAGPPALESMFEQVYDNMPDHLHAQQRQCREGPRATREHRHETR